MSGAHQPMAVVDDGLGNSSYLVDLGDRRGLVIDPTRDPSGYLALAERQGLQLAFAAETHLHADFVSGSAELAARGARILAPAAAHLEQPHHGLGDGDEIDLGGLRLRALATPGHTPEHLAYLLLDADQPMALFSGGSLLVGAMARTDLISPERTEELARRLWRSIHEQILTLPDELPVYPTHGAGSFCSAVGQPDRVTTVGREKATNPFLAAPDEDAFVKLFLSGLGTYPSYFLRLREVNRRGPRTLGEARGLVPLPPDEVSAQMRQGAWVIDARPIATFADGHILGALSNALRPAFASWLGWLVPDAAPLIFVLDDGQDRSDLVRQCHKVGYERLMGELAGGMDAWRAAGLAQSRISLVTPGQLADDPVLDVRQAGEFMAGRIAGSTHVELGALSGANALPPGPLVVTCGHGERAMSAASILERAGRRELSVLAGGVGGWAESGRPLVSAG